MIINSVVHRLTLQLYFTNNIIKLFNIIKVKIPQSERSAQAFSKASTNPCPVKPCMNWDFFLNVY